jgi:hypothetical protein
VHRRTLVEARSDANAAVARATPTPAATNSDDPHEQESVLSILSGTLMILGVQRRRNVPSIVAETLFVVPNSVRGMGCPEDAKYDEITMLQSAEEIKPFLTFYKTTSF